VKHRIRTAIGLWIGLAVLLAASGCIGVGPRIRIGELQTESRTVERGSADTVLAVRQPGYEGRASLWDVDDYRYEWDLRLNDDVSTDMSVKVGAGKSDLVLGSLSLTELQVETGAGEVGVDLHGASSLAGLTIKVGAGQLTVDLTGERAVDLDAEVEGGIGEATLRLPRDVGVRVEVQGGLGSVHANGFTKDGNTYVNEAYGTSDVTLRMDVQAGLGAINLELGE
jgi:hypothetical protein